MTGLRGGRMEQYTGVLSDVLSAAGIEAADGRALYRYSCSSDQYTVLDLSVRARWRHSTNSGFAAAFVLWAAEKIRSCYTGGPLRWDFLLEDLGDEDQAHARDLVDRGLSWWKRKTRATQGNRTLRLYILLAEGGLPDKMLQEPSKYQKVVIGLMRDHEELGTNLDSEVLINRWIQFLPQTIRSQELTWLLDDLARAIANLRAAVPAEVPARLIDRWLDKERPDWLQELPLRLSGTTLDVLIRPAMREERGQLCAVEEFATRELKVDATGRWRSGVSVAPLAFLGLDQLPSAKGRYLRLLPSVGVDLTAARLVYAGTPEADGWSLKRNGGGVDWISLAVNCPLVLDAYSDGVRLGEIELVSAVPDSTSVPSFWESYPLEAGNEAQRLQLLPGEPRTRGSCIWVRLASKENIEIDSGLTLEKGPLPVEGAYLWCVSGDGALLIDSEKWQIQTRSSKPSLAGVLLASGPTLGDWRVSETGSCVYLGTPRLYGRTARVQHLEFVVSSRLRLRPGRMFGSTISHWIGDDGVLASLQTVAFAEGSNLSLRESAVGQVKLVVSGFDPLIMITMGGTNGAPSVSCKGDGEISWSVEGCPPGDVEVELYDLRDHKRLKLTAPWPACSGMLLTPDGKRLEKLHFLSATSLMGWRAFVPQHCRGDLRLTLSGTHNLSLGLEVRGQMALGALVPLIRVLLAQGGPDAQVNMSLAVNGREVPRLEVGRYDDFAYVDDQGLLRLGLPHNVSYDAKFKYEGNVESDVWLHACDLTGRAKVFAEQLDGETARYLTAALGDSEGPWLVQARVADRIQRAAVWPHVEADGSRESRIVAATNFWRDLCDQPESEDWDRLWALMSAVAVGGDAGVLDHTQAIALVPAAAWTLAFVVRQAEVDEVLALDLACPQHWVTSPVAAAAQGLAVARERLTRRYAHVFDDKVLVEEEVHDHLRRQAGWIAALRPELRGHLALALMSQWHSPVATSPDGHAINLVLPKQLDRLHVLEQDAARRFDRAPTGLRPPKLITPRITASNFDAGCQGLLDAPWVAAAWASSGETPSGADIVNLIAWRDVDPYYFDEAVWLAICQISEQQAIQSRGKNA